MSNTSKILNILNGDCALSPFKHARLSGKTLVWREVYTEGPLDDIFDLPQFRANRAKFLSSITNYSIKQMQDWIETLDQSILNLQYGNILRLWFDACMFDQSILARILFLVNQIPIENRPYVELACENVIFSDAKIFSALNKKRCRLDDEDIRNGAFCWESFVKYNIPNKCSPTFRFMQNALMRRQQETPDLNGLGETMRRILYIVNNNSKHGISLQELFQKLSSQELYPWFGIETIQRFAATLIEKKLIQIKNEKYFALNA